MEQKYALTRQHPRGSEILIAASRLGKAATPKIKFIFSSENEIDYATARLSSA